MRGVHSVFRRSHSGSRQSDAPSISPTRPTATAPPDVGFAPTMDVESSVGSAPAGTTHLCGSSSSGNMKKITTADRDRTYDLCLLF